MQRLNQKQLRKLQKDIDGRKRAMKLMGKYSLKAIADRNNVSIGTVRYHEQPW